MKAEITKSNIEAILKFLPYFKKTKNDFYSISENYLEDPYFYSSIVSDFVKALCENNFMLDFDWPEWQCEASMLYLDDSLLKKADLETIMKLLTTHVRKERFCSGNLAMMIKKKHILKILKRLKKLYEESYSRY